MKRGHLPSLPGYPPAQSGNRGEDGLRALGTPRARGTLQPRADCCGEGPPHSHTYMHILTPDTKRLTRGLEQGGRKDPSDSLMGQLPMVSGLPPCSGVPLEGVRCSWAGARPPILFCLPCTDCLPAIPTHILFNNLSLLNYLLALPHHHPRLPLTCLFPQKQKNGNNKKKMRCWYICK